MRRYVSGRVRAQGEINGKSGNLNNCLQAVVYADTLAPDSGPADAATGSCTALAIPLQEVVVVFDADMACKSHFFRHVSAVSRCTAMSLLVFVGFL